MPWIAKDGYLTQAEKENNATIVIELYRYLNINDKTIAGILANMDAESTLSPLLNEVGGSGFGLVQWTPKSVLINHASTLGLSPYEDGTIQSQVIIKECQQDPRVNEWYSTRAFLSQGNWFGGAGNSSMVGITGTQFLNNAGDWSPDYLARLFMCAYERPAHDPAINHWRRRASLALSWYDFIEHGTFPPTPPIPPTPISGGWTYGAVRDVIRRIILKR